jgi:hypothetical protein
MSLLTRERPWQDALFFPRQLPGSGYADFHILDCEFASKVGIFAAGRYSVVSSPHKTCTYC